MISMRPPTRVLRTTFAGHEEDEDWMFATAGTV